MTFFHPFVTSQEIIDGFLEIQSVIYIIGVLIFLGILMACNKKLEE